MIVTVCSLYGLFPMDHFNLNCWFGKNIGETLYVKVLLTFLSHQQIFDILPISIIKK